MELVRVATGATFQIWKEAPQNRYVKGLLIATNRETFTVFTIGDLRTSVMSNTPSGTPEHERVGFQKLDLEQEMTFRQRQKPAEPKEFWFISGPALAEPAETFVLAWACWKQGLDTHALDLYRETKRLLRSQFGPYANGSVRGRLQSIVSEVQNSWERLTSKTPRKQPATLRQSIEQQLAEVLMWQAVLGFGDPSMTRTQLLAQFAMIARNFPESKHHQRAVDTATVLRQMIVEDRAHKEIDADAFEKLSVEEKVRELIFQLREQHAVQRMQPGWCYILDDWSGSTNTPAHQLVRVGYPAVPQLIAALDSDTFSRSIGYGRDFVFSHTVLTVGECVAQMLERITARQISIQRPWGGTNSAGVKHATELWWAEFQAKGEK